MENSVIYQPDLAKLKQLFEDARDTNDEYRSESLIDRDYFDGYQWTKAERDVLKKRQQPPIYFNEVKLAVRGLVGVFEQGETDPRAWPRTPQDEDSADVATKTLQFIKDYSHWSEARTHAAMNYFIEGTCAVHVGVDDNLRPEIEMIRFEEFFHDPRSRKHDFSDARYMGIAKWQFADDVAAQYPEQREEIVSSVDNSGSGLSVGGDTFADRPEGEFSSWSDAKMRRVFVVEMYHREAGVWQRCVFWGRGILESSVSPYLDNNGKPCNPIRARSCYVDRENRRYGEVRDLRSPQDAINQRESKLLHLLNNRQVQANPQADPAMAMATDAELVRQEASRPDGIIPPGWMPVSLNDMAAGQFSLLESAKGFVQRIGQNPSVLALQSASASGRAQLARQQAGMTDSAMSLNGLRQFELEIYRHCWMRARQFWKSPDWIRVTDDEGAPQFIGINQPVFGEMQPMLRQDGIVEIGRPVLGYQNPIAEMDVDITIDTVPDVANLAQEQFEKLAELAQVYGPQEVPFDDILAVSSIPDKQKIIARRKDRMQQQAQTGEMQQQIAVRGAVAEVAKTEAETVYTQARARNEALKPMIEGLKAGQAAGIPAAGG